jgi:hypothetical protein
MSADSLDTRTIQGVAFKAAREGRAWVAQIEQTGRTLPQHYATRPAMWDDLERMARLCGEEKFARDCGVEPPSAPRM